MSLKPLPQPSFTVVQNDRRWEQAWSDYVLSIDNMLRTATTVKLAAPNNANAKAAGVVLGGLYTELADPARVFIRTV